MRFFFISCSLKKIHKELCSQWLVVWWYSSRPSEVLSITYWLRLAYSPISSDSFLFLFFSSSFFFFLFFSFIELGLICLTIQSVNFLCDFLNGDSILFYAPSDLGWHSPIYSVIVFPIKFWLGYVCSSY